ncbi:MAG: hypothetical protein KGN74_13550 [Gemmatimonadota bacterium]|nr:hypothetical protein [Gemmatimonadota bacterium]
MTTPLHDVAVSAVAYDSILVGEIAERLAPRLRTRPAWAGAANEPAIAASPLAEESSRLVLVLHQRLWGHDDVTRSEAAMLGERARRRPASIVVAALDETPLPHWASGLPSCSLAALGVDGVADSVLDAVARSGGTLRPVSAPADGESAPHSWDAPKAFLQQMRAHAALQHELAALSSQLRPWFRAEEAQAGTHVVEFPARPNRLIARLDDIGVSFSWVPGQGGTVADGRLLVIEWAGLRRVDRGLEALKGGTPVRERVYRPEARDAERWQWRADEPNGRACNTAHLVGEWLSGALMARRGLENA